MLRKTSIFVLALLIAITARSQGKDALQRRVINASHSTRINDVEMKPWHLKVNFELYGHDGKISNAGTLEEWFAGLTLWKLRIESPAYTATVIENGKGYYRTQGAGPIPSRILAIERDIVYPMPMGEDLTKTVPHASRLKLEKTSLDCIQLIEPPVPDSLFATFCFDPSDGDLRAIFYRGSWSLIRKKVGQFQGHSAALQITARVGNVETEAASAEVVDLSEITLSDALFVPSSDMEKVTDVRTLNLIQTSN